jgi:hypothetical protein
MQEGTHGEEEEGRAHEGKTHEAEEEEGDVAGEEVEAETPLHLAKRARQAYERENAHRRTPHQLRALWGERDQGR